MTQEANHVQLLQNLHGTTFVKKFLKVKKKLKGKNISITESLTRYRMSVLNEAREKYGVKNVWTYGRWILYKDNNDGQKIKIYYDQNLFRGAYGYH